MLNKEYILKYFQVHEELCKFIKKRTLQQFENGELPELQEDFVVRDLMILLKKSQVDLFNFDEAKFIWIYKVKEIETEAEYFKVYLLKNQNSQYYLNSERKSKYSEFKNVFYAEHNCIKQIWCNFIKFRNDVEGTEFEFKLKKNYSIETLIRDFKSIC